MHTNIAKLCADSLREFSREKYGIKLKAAHAHELIAAYLGYRSKNSLLADTKYPISNLSQADIVVMIPDDQIDRRREKLKELPSELPDSYTLGEAVYSALFSEELWSSQLPPFKNFHKCAGYLLENNHAYLNTFQHYRDIPKKHIVQVVETTDSVVLTANHIKIVTDEEGIQFGESTITLPRIAGRIGFAEPRIMPTIRTGGRRFRVKLTEVRYVNS